MILSYLGITPEALSRIWKRLENLMTKTIAVTSILLI